MAIFSGVFLSRTQASRVITCRNRRLGKKVNRVLVQTFLYRDSLKPAAEFDGTAAIVARFIYGTNPVIPDYIFRAGVTYRVLTDFQGSPRLVVDTMTEAVVQRLDYDEFGNVVLDTNPGFQPFGFAGGLYGLHTKLTRFGARDYDAEAGRWTAKDPIRFVSGNTNLCGYVLDDPVNRLDPWGLSDCSDFVDSLVRVAQSHNTWRHGPDWLQRLYTGGDVADMYVEPGNPVRTVLGNPPGSHLPYRGLRGISGFRCELVQGGQGTAAGRHIAAAAAAVLEGPEFLVDIENRIDANQPITPRHSEQQRLAELAGNEAGRRVGRDIREFLKDNILADTLRERLTNILCGVCGQ